MIERLLIGLLTGHVLLEASGLAKTLTVRTLPRRSILRSTASNSLPILLPADVIGTQIYDQSTGLSIKKGRSPNIVLADESPRPASAGGAAGGDAREAGTIGGTTYVLHEPFLVLATRTPSNKKGPTRCGSSGRPLQC